MGLLYLEEMLQISCEQSSSLLIWKFVLWTFPFMRGFLKQWHLSVRLVISKRGKAQQPCMGRIFLITVIKLQPSTNSLPDTAASWQSDTVVKCFFRLPSCYQIKSFNYIFDYLTKEWHQAAGSFRKRNPQEYF